MPVVLPRPEVSRPQLRVEEGQDLGGFPVPSRRLVLLFSGLVADDDLEGCVRYRDLAFTLAPRNIRVTSPRRRASS